MGRAHLNGVESIFVMREQAAGIRRSPKLSGLENSKIHSLGACRRALLAALPLTPASPGCLPHPQGPRIQRAEGSSVLVPPSRSETAPPLTRDRSDRARGLTPCEGPWGVQPSSGQPGAPLHTCYHRKKGKWNSGDSLRSPAPKGRSIT